MRRSKRTRQLSFTLRANRTNPTRHLSPSKDRVYGSRIAQLGQGRASRIWSSHRNTKIDSRGLPAFGPHHYARGKTEQNPYTGELAAIANTLRSLPKLRYHNILLVTRNKAAALTLGKSRQQSGQRHIGEAYKAISSLHREENSIVVT